MNKRRGKGEPPKEVYKATGVIFRIDKPLPTTNDHVEGANTGTSASQHENNVVHKENSTIS